MLEASDKAGPVEQDPQMNQALDCFRRLSDLKPTPPETPKSPANLSISDLPPDVQERVRARAEVARKAKEEYWAYVEEQDAKETP